MEVRYCKVLTKQILLSRVYRLNVTLVPIRMVESAVEEKGVKMEPVNQIFPFGMVNGSAILHRFNNVDEVITSSCKKGTVKVRIMVNVGSRFHSSSDLVEPIVLVTRIDMQVL